MLCNLVERLWRKTVLREALDHRPVDLLVQGRLSERPGDLHGNVAGVVHEYKQLLAEGFRLLKRREAARPLRKNVAAKLLIDQIVADGLAEDRMTDAR